MNKNSDPVHIFYIRVAGEDNAPTEIIPNFWNYPKRVELRGSYSGCRLI